MKKKYKTIRELKNQLRNFSRWGYNEYDDDGKSKEELLEEKCSIISYCILSPNLHDEVLSPEEILDFLEKCSNSWTCSGEECQAAIKQVGRVLAYLTGATDEKPESMAVAEPAEVIYKSTDPLILLGRKNPFNYVKDTVKKVEYHADACFEEHENDKDFRDAIAEGDFDYIDQELGEEIKHAILEGIDDNRDAIWHLYGNDELIHEQGMVSPDRLSPDKSGDPTVLDYAIRCELMDGDPECQYDTWGLISKYGKLWGIDTEKFS